MLMAMHLDSTAIDNGKHDQSKILRGMMRKYIDEESQTIHRTAAMLLNELKDGEMCWKDKNLRKFSSITGIN